jgi:hypothetical protein
MENNQEKDLNMKKSSENEQITESVEQQGRREVVQKLGKFAAYAAPFTVLAFTKKASAASGHGSAKHP